MSLHHVFVGERLTAFSDAVFAIIVTIMVIPLKLTDQDIKDYGGEDGFYLDEWLEKGTFFYKFSIYLYAYLVVIHVWYSHNRLFRLVELVDDIIAWFNLVFLLFVSFLPAALNMIYSFRSQPVVLSISIGNILIVNATLLILIFLAFRQKSLLHPRLLKDMHLLYLKIIMYVPVLVKMAGGVIALIFAWGLKGTPEVGFVLFYSMGVLPLIGRLITWILYKKMSKSEVPNELHEFLIRDVVSKERTIAFSDGVFSIVATLLILDITTEIPKTDESVQEYLDSHKYEFSTYLASFFIVGLLWFVHHSMFQYFKEMTSLMTAFNSVSLMFVGLIPFGAGVISHFAEGLNTENEVTSIRTFGVVLVIASLSQLVLWTVAHCDRKRCLTSDVDNTVVELIQLAKLLIFPLTGLLFYFVTFSEGIIVHHFFSFMAYTTPVLFILPRVCAKLFSRLMSGKNHPPSTKSDEESNQLLKESALQGQYVLQIQQTKSSVTTVAGDVETGSSRDSTPEKTKINPSQNMNSPNYESV